jgi:hypothetical protein
MGTLREDICTFMILCHWILLRMRNISDKSCRENCAVYEIMCKNMVQQDRPEMAIYYSAEKTRHARIHTHTHSQYSVLVAPPWQQCLRKCASMLCYMCTFCLVKILKLCMLLNVVNQLD